MMAAVLAEGTTVLVNAAREPEVPDLAEALNRAGARIEGAGKHSIHIQGVRELRPLEPRHDAGPHRGRYVPGGGTMTGGDVTVTHCVPEHLRALLDKLQQAGAEVETDDGHVRVRRANGCARSTSSPRRIRASRPICRRSSWRRWRWRMASAFSPRRSTPIASRTSPSCVAWAPRSGSDGNIAVVTGSTELSGAPVMATDLRASAALILAALRRPGPHRDLARLPHRPRLRAHRREVRRARRPDRAPQERGIETPHAHRSEPRSGRGGSNSPPRSRCESTCPRPSLYMSEMSTACEVSAVRVLPG